MIELATNLIPLLTLGATGAPGAETGVIPVGAPAEGPWWLSLIPGLPLVASVACLGFLAKAVWNIARYGFNTLKNAVVQGQYEYPRGLFFGGNGPAKVVGILGDAG